MSHHDRKPILTMANAPAIIAAFLAGARAYDVSFQIEEGPSEVVVWLEDKPPAEIVRSRLEGYLLGLVIPGIGLRVVLTKGPQ